MSTSDNSNIFTRQAETALGQPDCVAVGAQFVCDITMELTDAPTGANSSGIASSGITVVEAALTCPMGQEGINLAATDHRTCGCTAVLTPVGNSTARPPRECSCHYCQTVQGAAPNLALDCSKFTADPFVNGNCKAIDCDGTCLDALPDIVTDTPNTNITAQANATQMPTTATATQVPNITQAPTNSNATQPPTQAVTTQEPAAAQPPTTAPATIPPTSSGNNTNNNLPTDTDTTTDTDSTTRRWPWWIPSSFSVTSPPIQTLDQQHIQAIQDAYLKTVQQVVDTLQQDNNADTNTNTNTTRYLRSRQLESNNNVIMAPNAAEIYHTEPTDCPSGSDAPPGDVACHNVYARYLLLLQPNADTDAISNLYITTTQDLLAEKQFVPDHPDIQLISPGGRLPLTPAPAQGACQLCDTPGQEPKRDINLPTSSSQFNCGTVADLYAKQPAQQCLNYANTQAFRKRLSPNLQSFLQDFPLFLPDYCQCSPPETINAVEAPTTCKPFCPDNRQIPQANQDIAVDTNYDFTCADMESFADAVLGVPKSCLDVARHGALCCTQEIAPEPNVTTPEPTPPPTQNGTLLVRVNNSFLVYNVRGLTADVLTLGPELPSISKAYAAFAAQVVWELAGATATSINNPETEPPVTSNETRYIRSRALSSSLQPRQRRRLSVTLDSSSSRVHTILDTTCPTTVPFNSSCSVAYGSYDLLLWEEDDPAYIGSQYTNYSQDAIDRGVLNDTLTRVDPLTWVRIKGATDDLVPPRDLEPTVSIVVTAQEGGYDEFFMIGIGLSIAIIVVCLVGIICAADYSTYPDDDSVDPWEKETARSSSMHNRQSSMHSRQAAASKEKAPSKQSVITDPQTDKQEYLMYREQVEKLIMQKSPEEEDNIDELMDLFYQRETLLIATLKHMPDASERPEEEEEEEADIPNNASLNFNDSMVSDWDGGSSDEFAEETRDGSEDEAEAEEEAQKKKDEYAARRSSQTIQEGEEGEEETDLESEREEESEEEEEPHSEPLVMGDDAESLESADDREEEAAVENGGGVEESESSEAKDIDDSPDSAQGVGSEERWDDEGVEDVASDEGEGDKK